MPNKLDQLKTMTTVVADTGDINAIEKYQPEDATTNPSLLLKAVSDPQYQSIVMDAIKTAKAGGSEPNLLNHCTDALAVKFGCEILRIIPGKVSTEIDPRLSFNTQATVDRGLSLIERYQNEGVAPDRILLKIASTWEGIKAAETLEKQGIHCNLTLLFSLTQAMAAADAGAYLISPFVGRILDWYKANTEQKEYSPQEDPGVVSVTEIFNYYKSNSYSTVVMGASFRNTGEIEALAGCDRLTISPALMDQLAGDETTLQRALDASQIPVSNNRQVLDEAQFRFNLNADAMATEKLAEGIRNFVADQVKLEQLITSLL